MSTTQSHHSSLTSFRRDDTQRIRTSKARAMSLGLALAAVGTCAKAKDHQQVTATPVFSADRNSAGQPIVFPRENGHVTVSVLEIAPGTTLPVHKHPFPRMGYVLDGTLRVTNLQNGVSQTFKAGDFILEAVNEWHEGTNPGSKTLRLLVIDLIEKGAENTVLKDAPPRD